jgi:hypothetical protein
MYPSPWKGLCLVVGADCKLETTAQLASHTSQALALRLLRILLLQVVSGFDLLAGADCMVQTPPGLGLAVLSGLTYNPYAHGQLLCYFCCCLCGF